MFFIYHSFFQHKVAYVKNDVLLAEFQMTKDLNQKLEITKLSRRQELDSIELKIASMIEVDSLSENVLTLRKIYQKRAELYSEEIVELSQQLNQQIENRVNQYLKEYCKENGYDIVLGASGTGSLLFAKDEFNITDDLIDYINKKYEDD